MKMRVHSVYNKSSCGKQPPWYHTSMHLVLHWFSGPRVRSGGVGNTVLRCAKTSSEDIFFIVTTLWLCCEGNASELKATVHKEWTDSSRRLPEVCIMFAAGHKSKKVFLYVRQMLVKKHELWYSVLNLAKKLVILVLVRYCNYSCLICALGFTQVARKQFVTGCNIFDCKWKK